MNKLNITFFYYCLIFFKIIHGTLVSADHLEVERYYTIQLSQSEQETLSTFFRFHFEDTTAGYVLLGSKPLFLGGYTLKPTPHLSSKKLNMLEKSRRIWGRINIQPSQYSLVFSQHEESVKIRIINHIAFKEVVEKNLHLFQKQLGFNLTSESLLQKILDPKTSLTELFCDQTALLGIILGYGTENSLLAERTLRLYEIAYEGICEDEMIEKDQNKDYRELFLSLIAKKTGTPSFGFESIQDEAKVLTTELSPPFCKNHLKIVFMHRKNTEETIELFTQYKHAQTKVDALLNNNAFLEEILAIFNLKTTYPPNL